MNAKNRRNLWVSIALSALWVGGGCHKKSEGEEGAKGKGRGRASGPVPVRITTLEKKITPRLVEVVAALAGQKQVDVFSKVTGRLTYIGAKEGEAIKAGDVIFRIDRSDPGETFLNVPTLSPFSGWIGRWQVINVGEQVTPSDPIVTVVDDRVLRATAYLPTEDWLDVKATTTVTASFGGEERPAKVMAIARAADRATGRGSVSVEVDNPARDWRSGVYARLKFAVDSKERMLLSAGALTITDDRSFVYIVEGESARRIPVEFSTFDADTVEITKGLAAGAKIVTVGANLLGDKSQVRIVD